MQLTASIRNVYHIDIGRITPVHAEFTFDRASELQTNTYLPVLTECSNSLQRRLGAVSHII